MVCTREAPLAERAVGVLEALLSGQRGYEADLCTSLRPALLQALQRLNMESMGHGFGQGHTAQGKGHNLIKLQYVVLQKYCTNTCCIPKATTMRLKFIEIDDMYSVMVQFKNLLNFKISQVMFLSGQHGEMMKIQTAVLIDPVISNS